MVELERKRLLAKLAGGPKSSSELDADGDTLRALASEGFVNLDADPWPDEYVPGNPLIARLPGDGRPWPGWKRWNL